MLFSDASKNITTTGTVAVVSGGTGLTSYTDGQLLIGKTAGNTLVAASLTGTASQITVTPGSGTITLATPQNIATSSSPTFAGLSLGTGTLGFTNGSFTSSISLNSSGSVLFTPSSTGEFDFQPTSSTSVSKKINLFDAGNTDSRFSGFGIDNSNSLMLDRILGTTWFHVWQAGQIGSTALELMRLGGNGQGLALATDTFATGGCALTINQATGRCVRLQYNTSTGTATAFTDQILDSNGDISFTYLSTAATPRNIGIRHFLYRGSVGSDEKCGARIFFQGYSPNNNLGYSIGYNGADASGILNWPATTFVISRHNTNDGTGATGIINLQLDRGTGKQTLFGDSRQTFPTDATKYIDSAIDASGNWTITSDDPTTTLFLFNSTCATRKLRPNGDNLYVLGDASNRWSDFRTVLATVSTTLNIGDGKVATPSLTFASDTNTGIYSIAADNLGITCGGTKLVDIIAAGITKPIQPSFNTYITGGDIVNVTGDGTNYGPVIFNAEQHDAGSNVVNGTFTAPVSGRYFLTSTITLGGLLVAHTSAQIALVSTAVAIARVTANP